MDYSKYKPGIYLQIGDLMTPVTSTKSSSFLAAFGASGGAVTGVEALAEKVAWIYIALQKRRELILEIPHDWEQNGEVIGNPPFGASFRELLQQIDSSLQVHSRAYILKQRGEGTGGVLGLRWLDPNTVRPHYESATPEDGVLTYIRTNSNGKETPLPADDLLVFTVPGLRELRPGASAADATSLAASILHGIDQTAATLYRNNALPVMLVVIPRESGKKDRLDIQNMFRRIFNGGRGTEDVRTAAVLDGVTVTPLSYAPKDLDQSPLTENQINAILAAHGVPKSIALSNAANYATANEDKRTFVGTVGGRFDYIAEVLNGDPAFIAASFMLKVKVNEHYSQKEDEAQRADAFGKYLAGFTQEAAAFLVGIKRDDFPDDFEGIFLDDDEADAPAEVPPGLVPFQQGQAVGVEFGGSNAPPDDEADAEAKTFRRWLKKRTDPDVDDFAAKHLTPEDKRRIYAEVKPDPVAEAVATMDDIGESVEAFLTWAEENDPELARVLLSSVSE